MKTARDYGFLASLLFIISHFLPAYGGDSGFACFEGCWGMLSGQYARILDGAWFYYSGFVVAEILFIALLISIFVTKKCRKLRLFLSVVSFLHVLSWLVLQINFEQPSKVAEIKIGYYVWLLAYGILVAAHLRKQAGKSIPSIPFGLPAA